VTVTPIKRADKEDTGMHSLHVIATKNAEAAGREAAEAANRGDWGLALLIAGASDPRDRSAFVRAYRAEREVR
jgi:hypothetical protein